MRKTLNDHEAKIVEMKAAIRELAEWRRLLSAYPSVPLKIEPKMETAEDVKKEMLEPIEGEKKP